MTRILKKHINFYKLHTRIPLINILINDLAFVFAVNKNVISCFFFYNYFTLIGFDRFFLYVLRLKAGQQLAPFILQFEGELHAHWPPYLKLLQRRFLIPMINSS